MNVTIGILAHVDAGKTTLSEQILFKTGVLRKAGRVDHADTLLDFEDTERARGITIYSGQASFSYADKTFFLLDTPGHTDFSPEMERILPTLDYAVLVVSSVEGIQAHTWTIWRLLERLQIPVFLFLNKTDRPGADVQRTMSQIRSQLSSGCLLLENGFESCAEEIALCSETLLEAYVENGYSESVFVSALRELVIQRQVFPCCSGSALTSEGVDCLLDLLGRVCVTCYNAESPLSARVYKVRAEESGRITFLKIISGTLYAKQTIGEEKIHEIRQYNGKKYTSVPLAKAGEICAVTGLTVACGASVGESLDVFVPQMVPVLRSSVLWSDTCTAQTVLDALRTLAQQAPELEVQWLPDTQKINISVMGEVQLEVLQEALLRRFGLHCTFGEGEILYKETILAPSYGCGHFEPLRHYAEVHLAARPLPCGSGIRFLSACPTDVLQTNWQRLIETHVLEKTHIGAQCGFPLTDVEFVLLAGRAHEKHTEGGDFRQSTYRAIRNALFHAQSVLLEPYYRFRIAAPGDCLGRILSDLEHMSAVYDPPQIAQSQAIVTGRCPASEMLGYKTTLTAFTKGYGTLFLQFDGYAPCHNTQAVLERHPYDRERDVDNPADSVFCSHGSGFVVKWDQAKKYMHCEVDKSVLTRYTEPNDQ